MRNVISYRVSVRWRKLVDNAVKILNGYMSYLKRASHE